MRAICSFVIAALCLIATYGAAFAEKRAALVIGNSLYRNVPNLPNPVNDAREMAALFKASGFDTVDVRLNLGIAALREAVRDFAEAANDADIAVVYFAGHGIEVDGANFIIPVDARLMRDFDIEDETISLDRILKAVESTKRLRLIILDACRDNPFLKTMKRTVASRSVGRGLARVEPATSDTLIAFAAKAGSVALDGNAKNSPFTTALVNNIAAPGLDLRIALGKVRDEVLKMTDRRQEPFVYGSLGGSIVSIVNAPPEPKVVAPLPADEIVWNAVKDSGHPAIFSDFATKFPTSRFRVDAEARRDELQKRSDAAAVAVAAPPTDQVVWNAIKDSPHPAVFEEFLAKFPASSQATVARSRLEEIKRTKVAVASPPPPQIATEAREKAAGRINIGLKVLSDTDEGSLKLKSVLKECDKCPELVVVPDGAFVMGSPESERQREAIEGPQRQVTFKTPFAVGRFAITFEEWDTCVADGGCNGYLPWDNGWGRGKRPVINVSWHDAKSYVAWLSSRTGKTYRLLSETEREYVTRAGTTTPYWLGSSISAKAANFSAQGLRNDKKAIGKKTLPVDSFQANPWGLFQVHGNVWEWIDDCMIDGYAGAPADGATRTKDPCERRVLRGGSWISEPGLLRAAARYGVQADGRVSNVGFRVARTLNIHK